ncbi:tRNA pseudouridine(13) synthase TruD, partial [Erwinia amylovora]|nr:tRNA pseudouridine(13) synthase TruD [Erwinia amylovora]
MYLSGQGWVHGKPTGSGVLKSSRDDFVVFEDLCYAPVGVGEQLMVRLRKHGCNSSFCAVA